MGKCKILVTSYVLRILAGFNIMHHLHAYVSVSGRNIINEVPECLPLAFYISRLTVVSREAKKKQHACASSGPRDHYSELFTRMAALKF